MQKVLLITILIFTAFVQCQSQVNETFDKRIDSLFEKFNGGNSPGFAVGIFSDTAILYKKGYGLANLEYNIPITAETKFNIASLSKQFTAACIALLVLQGKISLDDDAARYIDNFPSYKYPVKIKHLVYMTSGIKDYYTLPRDNGLSWNPYFYFSIDTAVASSLKEPGLEYDPGSKWTYSNINYMLLTKIVEKISGVSFAAFARENIFAPLGMMNTLINDDVTQVIKNRAMSYNYRNKENINDFTGSGMKLGTEGEFIQIHRNSPHYGGSGLYTTIDDLFIWNRNFYKHYLAGQEFYELMHRREKFAHPKDNDAFGLVFGNYKGLETVWYEGGDLGVSSYMVRFPLQKITIVCISNLGNAGAQSFTNKIADILIEDKIIDTSLK